MNKHRHSWSKWDNTSYVHGQWVRYCYTCDQHQRKRTLNFVEWLWNMRP